MRHSPALDVDDVIICRTPLSGGISDGELSSGFDRDDLGMTSSERASLSQPTDLPEMTAKWGFLMTSAVMVNMASIVPNKPCDCETGFNDTNTFERIA